MDVDWLILTLLLNAFGLYAYHVIELSADVVNGHIHGRQVRAESSVNNVEAGQHAVGTIRDALHFNQCN